MIDQLVYALYNFRPEEIAIVWGINLANITRY